MGLQQFLQEESFGLRGKVVCVSKNQAKGFCCLVGNKNHIIFGFNFLREEKRKAKAFLIPHVTIHTWLQVSFIEYVPARGHDRPCFTGGETEAQKSEPTMKPAKRRRAPGSVRARCRLEEPAQAPCRPPKAGRQTPKAQSRKPAFRRLRALRPSHSFRTQDSRNMTIV